MLQELHRQHQAHKERRVRLSTTPLRPEPAKVIAIPIEAFEVPVQIPVQVTTPAEWPPSWASYDVNVSYLPNPRAFQKFQFHTMSGLIQAAVSNFYNISRREIRSGRRAPESVHARHMAFYLCKTMTEMSLPQIGIALGGRDHTTVLHGFRRIASLMETDARTKDEVDLLTMRITDHVNAIGATGGRVRT